MSVGLTVTASTPAASTIRPELSIGVHGRLAMPREIRNNSEPSGQSAAHVVAAVRAHLCAAGVGVSVDLGVSMPWGYRVPASYVSPTSTAPRPASQALTLLELAGRANPCRRHPTREYPPQARRQQDSHWSGVRQAGQHGLHPERRVPVGWVRQLLHPFGRRSADER